VKKKAGLWQEMREHPDQPETGLFDGQQQRLCMPGPLLSHNMQQAARVSQRTACFISTT
jgi:ABC-type phosphate transport system ATPase subunit